MSRINLRGAVHDFDKDLDDSDLSQGVPPVFHPVSYAPELRAVDRVPAVAGRPHAGRAVAEPAVPV